MRVYASLFMAFALAASGQQPAQPPPEKQLQPQRPQTGPVAFDVATIKEAPPLDPTKMMNGRIKFGAKIDGARAEYSYMSLSDLICSAYKIKPYQLSGPDWMKTQRWEIQATLPEGATADQAPLMLQELLKDRFKLEIHHDTKEHNIYALVQGKGGNKLKDAEPDPVPGAAEAPAAGAAAGEAPKPGTPPPPAKDDAPPKDAKGPQGGTMTVNGDNISMKRTSDGAVLRGGKMGTTKVTMKGGMPGADGKSTMVIHMEFSKADMPGFVEMLSPFVDRPVIDETGLKGKYQIGLDLSMADMMNVARQSGMMGAMGGGPPGGPGGAGAAGGPGAARPAESASDPGGSSSVFAAVEQLGLKLAPRKGPIETVVVDHLEKTPTEN